VTAVGGLERRGRPTGTVDGTDLLPPMDHPDRNAARAVANARARRLAEQVRVRVRCSGALHTIELAGGRLRLVDHPACDRAFYRAAPVQLARCLDPEQLAGGPGRPAPDPQGSHRSGMARALLRRGSAFPAGHTKATAPWTRRTLR
jgi:hypothetical protein